MLAGPINRLRRQSALFCGVSVAVIAIAAPGAAFAQAASDPNAEASQPTTPASTAQQTTNASEEDITVTATRVVRDGYRAPTPTSVIGAAEIQRNAPTNLADFVNELPQMAPTNTPRANVGFVSAGLVGINALNLRNLGANRTLVLLDGQRVGASSLTGLVDVNTFPQTLVRRIDVVTGGASADWGSDAVAGVVNFILDRDFTGLRGQVQGGVTTYGDDWSYNVSLAAGARFGGGRGHILLSGEIAHNDGIDGIGDRRWYDGSKLFFNPAFTPTNGQPQLIVARNAGFGTATPGGLITSGPLRGTYFGQGGTPTQFNYGPIISGNFMVGGDARYADFATSGDLNAEMSSQSVFGRLSYEVADHVELFVQGSYSRATAFNAALDQFNFGNITIQPDNAFIPASIAPRVTGPFQLGTFNEDLGPITATTQRESWRGVIGARGDFSALGSDWTWDVYGQRTFNNIYTESRVSITANYNRAIDSVRNANGAIVCRSTLTDPNNGCVPYNIFGVGVNTDAARNYVLGTPFGRTKLTQDVLAATLRGEPFSTWAGPVSIATGIEHRREAVTGTNDPSITATVRPYFAANYLASRGSYDVTELFLATVIPLALDVPFAETLDFNGAVRSTWYSTSGYVTTWKAGLTYSPVSDITFRATRSRDIRAPNLAEFFQAGQTSTTSFTDPFNGNASVTAFQVTSGNPALRPERADSLGLGIVLQPRFVPGFAMSADYYDIRIRDAISTVTAALVVNQCFLGNTSFCSQITRNASNVITSVAVLPVNVARQNARGLDFEASYRRPAFGGNLSLRGLATRFIRNYSNDGITPPTDTVGTNGTNGTIKNSLPKWRYSATIAWDSRPLALSLTARGVSAGVYNTSYIECTSSCPTSTAANMTINNNRLPGALYLDANVTVRLPHDIEAFLAVDNLLNKDPAQMAFGPGIGIAPLSVNPLIYDVFGRTFRAGIRFRM